MKRSSIAACLTVMVVAATGYAQTLTFDFEGITDVSELADWVFIDDQTHDVGGVPTQYLDTIQIETEIVHGGSQALRLGVYDIAYFPLNGQFGTLDLWAYDYGWPVRGVIGAPTSAYGPRFGLRKFMDFDTSIYYPDNEPVDYGLLNRGFGIGAGLIEKTYLDSTAGYGAEWGNTPHMDIAVISSATADYDPATPAVNAGWAGDQSWWSPSWFGYLPNGRPASGGWNHWRIAYTAPGVVEITLVQSAGGDSRTATGTPANAFDGTTPGGVSDLFLFGGSTMIEGAQPEQWFGDGIFDDITWTPLGPTLQADFDGDGDVDLDDFVILKQNFGIGTTHAEGDADGNGAVDLDDFVILKQEFGSTS